MSDNKYRYSLIRKTLQLPRNPLHVSVVKSARRLIEDKNIPSGHQRARNSYTLSLTSGQRHRVPFSLIHQI